MNKSLTIFVLVAAAVLLSANGAAARRLRTNPNRGKYSTAAPLAEEPSADTSARISVETLENKFSFTDPAADKFKTQLESDRKSFGVNSDSGVNSPFADAGTSTSSFGKGLRKRKPSYQISEESEEEPILTHDTGSYEVNYKTKVTHKPGPSFDSGSFKFSSVTSAPKTKFGSSSKFSPFGSSSNAPSGLFKFNDPQSGHSSGAITTKFAISHPTPTHTAANLGGSYQTFSEESFGGNSGHETDKFLSDYHSTLAKLKKDKPKFQTSSPFKTKFTDTSNFKVSSDFKVASESHQPQFQKTKFGSDFNNFNAFKQDFKPDFKLQEVPNLYPSEDQFRPSVGYPGANGNQLFEPNSDNNEDYIKQLAKNPASKGQYQQYLKAQEDEKIEQQAVQEQLKYQQQQQPKAPPKLPISRPHPQAFNGASTKFRPYITVKKNFNRRKPLVRVSSSPGLSHYRTPLIDGPYTIHFSV